MACRAFFFDCTGKYLIALSPVNFGPVIYSREARACAVCDFA
jgi:hypothetical protein